MHRKRCSPNQTEIDQTKSNRTKSNRIKPNHTKPKQNEPTQNTDLNSNKFQKLDKIIAIVNFMIIT
jgi:hypothetical protein